jgi:AraC family transcriptional regulator of adaptative response/methylated-DNA-[protein]-cysteine methyltransferase
MIATAQPNRLAAVMARDAHADGAFVYAVTSTGVYCRPSCASRRPKPANIRFFDLPEAARRSGFRPCRRCRPDEAAPADPQLAAVRRACVAIERNLASGDEGVPTLAALAAAAHLSPHHLQRVFTRLIGISPKAYADALRLARLKRGLKAGNGVADAVYDAGYGSASRVYERAGAQLGMTPATYARGGAGAKLAVAVAPSPLGQLLIAATARGVAAVYLGDDGARLMTELKREFPAATIRRDDDALRPWVDAIVRHLEGRLPHIDLPLDVRATAFQWRVWQALRAIPLGETRSYGDIARAIGAPKAVRAVGHACATNPVSILVPCHRVLRGDGGLGGYRWGLKRKKELIARERVHAGAST